MKFAWLGAAVLAATALVTPVMAQEVITNPGRCAQFYPDANCQNLGPGNPFTGDGYRAAYGNGGAYGSDQAGWRNGYAYMGPHRGRHHHHRHHH
jgi:hypothetical protein